MRAHSQPIDETASFRQNPRERAFFDDPYGTYAKLHAEASDEGPIFFWQDYGHWVFGGLETVNALFRDKRLGRQILHRIPREELGWPPRPPHLAAFDAAEAHSLLELEPPDHTRLRGLINRAFVSRQIEQLIPSIEERAQSLLRSFAPDHPVDLISQFAEPLAVSTIADMLGIDQKHGPRLLAWSHAMVKMYMPGRTSFDETAANTAANAFSQWVRAIVRTRRKAPGTDLLSQLVHIEDSTDRLSEDEVVSTVILLLNAGHEATVHAMGNGLRILLDTGRERRAAWLQDADALVEEVLRYAPPLHMFTRYVLEDCELFGHPFKAGDVVGLHLGMANHDPRAMANPQQFDPSRVPVKQVAFGAGIHFCIGHALARLELARVLPLIFDFAPAIEVCGRLITKDAYHFHGLEALPVRLEPVA
ncbi:MAG: cytochrome P450 [Pseudomonadota bacterium]